MDDGRRAPSRQAQCRHRRADNARARLGAVAYGRIRDAARGHEPRMASQARPQIPQGAGFDYRGKAPGEAEGKVRNGASAAAERLSRTRQRAQVRQRTPRQNRPCSRSESGPRSASRAGPPAPPRRNKCGMPTNASFGDGTFATGVRLQPAYTRRIPPLASCTARNRSRPLEMET